MKKKTFIWSVILSMLFITAAVSIYGKVSTANQLSDAEIAVNALFKNEKHTILSSNISADSIQTAETAVSKLSDSENKAELTNDVAKAKSDFSAKTEITTLLSGSDLTTKDINNAKKLNETITDTSLQKSLAKEIKQAQKQIQTKKSVLLDVPLLNQMDAPVLYNGCEATSMAMLLQYEGYDVSKTAIANALPTVPLESSDGYDGNPNDGFVGDITGDSPGLGVYHGPMAETAAEFTDADSVHDITGADLDEIKSILSEGHPVWIITTTSFGEPASWTTFHTTSGDLDITYSMHSVVITGYDDDYFYINNPYGYKDQAIDKDLFEVGYEAMGQQAIYVD
ncbi:C39 family peptidase [Listeria costaricensis]|uniref:C39 family peptidase n=1 Tax=Listeria costaricensis TaxID=2026604 RepID=UPI000C074D0D|nr:C39 family peptidase [Listeria costaricensis]